MSMKAEVKVKGLDELLRDFKKAGGDAQPLVKGALTNSTTYVQKDARRRAAHASGELQRSILPEIRYPVGEVAVNAKHGAAVEEGTNPHTPPAAAIERWISKKGIPGSALWPIIKTIEKKGTKAQPFFKPAWEASQNYIEDQFSVVTTKLVNLMAKGRI